MQPLRCTDSQMISICADLAQFGAEGHERITWTKNRTGEYIPATSEKEFWLIRLIKYLFCLNETDEKVAEHVLRFFQVNQTHLAGQEQTVSKFQTLANGDKTLRTEFATLTHQLYEASALKKTEQQRQTILHDAESSRAKIAQETEEKRKASLLEVEQTKNRMLKEVADQTNAAKAKGEAEIKLVTEVLKEQTAKLAKVKTMIDESADTLIICAGHMEKPTSMKLLMQTNYFKQFFESRMTSTQLTEAQSKLYPNVRHGFNFLDVAPETMQLFLDYLMDPAAVAQVKEVDILIELYKFADYIDCEALKKALVPLLDKVAQPDDMLTVLTTAQYLPTDPLVQQACARVAAEFETLGRKPQFLDVKHEYLIELLKRDDLQIDGEMELFEMVKKWVDAHVTATKTAKDIFHDRISGQCLIEHIRFEHFTKEEFRHVVERNLLEASEKSKWEQYFLYDDTPLPNIRPPRPFVLFVKRMTARTMEVEWRIPAAQIIHLREQVESQKFQFANKRWRVEAGVSAIHKGKHYLSVSGIDNQTFDYQVYANQLKFDSRFPGERLMRYAIYKNQDFGSIRIAAAYYDPKELVDLIDKERGFLPVKFAVQLH